MRLHPSSNTTTASTAVVLDDDHCNSGSDSTGSKQDTKKERVEV
jgi:hypothetical protein